MQITINFDNKVVKLDDICNKPSIEEMQEILEKVLTGMGYSRDEINQLFDKNSIFLED